MMYQGWPRFVGCFPSVLPPYSNLDLRRHQQWKGKMKREDTEDRNKRETDAVSVGDMEMQDCGDENVFNTLYQVDRA